MAGARPFFYGWYLVGVAWVLYGFGIAPSYYSWGLFSREIIADLDLNVGELGGVFGLFTFMYSFVGFAVGYCMVRWGIRSVMAGGFLMTAAGALVVSRADTAMDCYLGFSLLGGTGIGFATIIPCQTLGQNWFLKYRGLAIGIILTAGGIVGLLVTRVDVYVLEHWTWRTGFVLIAGVSALLAFLAVLFIRDTPEQVGQRRDGMTAEEEEAYLKESAKHARAHVAEQWTAGQAVRTPQFVLLVFCGIAYAVPWGVVVPHGRLHLEALGFGTSQVASIIGAMALISTFGRLGSFLGDWLSPQHVLAWSLALEAAGVAGFIVADSTWVAYASVAAIGIGFGTAYSTVPVVFSEFFGRKAFGVTSGYRIMITGIFNGLGPWLTGMVYDRVESYTVPFIVLVALGLLGAFSAAIAKHPGAPPVRVQANPFEQTT